MTSPQGWYPDPGGSTALRWYDGERWTEHLAPLRVPLGGPTTPDGEPLAGWGRRVGAYLVDVLVVVVVGALLGLPWVLDVVAVYGDYLDALTSGSAVEPEETVDLYGRLAGPVAGLSLLQLLVGLVYHVGQWRWRAASLGMVLVGIRIRTWESPSRLLDWGPILKRWAMFYGIGALAVIPVFGLLASVYVWLAALWPLWDARRQGLHDKAAGTVVVRTVAP